MAIVWQCSMCRINFFGNEMSCAIVRTQKTFWNCFFAKSCKSFRMQSKYVRLRNTCWRCPFRRTESLQDYSHSLGCIRVWLLTVMQLQSRGACGRRYRSNCRLWLVAYKSLQAVWESSQGRCALYQVKVLCINLPSLYCYAYFRLSLRNLEVQLYSRSWVLQKIASSMISRQGWCHAHHCFRSWYHGRLENLLLAIGSYYIFDLTDESHQQARLNCADKQATHGFNDMVVSLNVLQERPNYWRGALWTQTREEALANHSSERDRVQGEKRTTACEYIASHPRSDDLRCKIADCGSCLYPLFSWCVHRIKIQHVQDSSQVYSEAISSPDIVLSSSIQYDRS